MDTKYLKCSNTFFADCILYKIYQCISLTNLLWSFISKWQTFKKILTQIKSVFMNEFCWKSIWCRPLNSTNPFHWSTSSINLFQSGSLKILNSYKTHIHAFIMLKFDIYLTQTKISTNIVDQHKPPSSNKILTSQIS